jgi:hypothetical protein
MGSIRYSARWGEPSRDCAGSGHESDKNSAQQTQETSRDFFDVHFLNLLKRDGCPICRDRALAERRYFFWYFHENWLQLEARDHLTRALGFCRDHAARLLCTSRFEPQVASVHLWAARRIRVALDAIPRKSHLLRTKAIFRNTARCPACQSGDDQVERGLCFLAKAVELPSIAEQYGNPALLCFSHLAAILLKLSRSNRELVLGAHASVMARQHQFPDASNGPCHPTGFQLRSALGLSDGLPFGRQRLPDPRAGTMNAKGLDDEAIQIIEHLVREDACPVCLEERRAWFRSAAQLEAAAHGNGGFNALLPTCPDHVWAMFRYGTPALVSSMAVNRLALSRVGVRKLIDTLGTRLDPWPQRLRHRFASFLGSPYGRSRRPRPGIDGGILSCPICLRMARARTEGLEQMLALLEKDRHRSDYEAGHGLCLKHLDLALTLRPELRMVDFLVDVAAVKLSGLILELERCVHGPVRDAGREPREPKPTAGQRALLRFSGSLDPLLETG